jgi:hypothetical protein
MATVPSIQQQGHKPWLVFGLVYAWKTALLLLSAQPVPANDSFFYDGAVVNYLLHGQYANPALALALPISGTEVFSAYPPLYQLMLLGWMAVFGTTALSAMVLHLVLFGLYMLLLLAIFRRLNTPAWCVYISGGFLLLITFHDRPDSLAHVLGMAAVYAWVRSAGIGGAGATKLTSEGWRLLAGVFVVLTLCTSLQIGGTYFLLVGLGMVAASLFGKEKLSLSALAVMMLVPVGLIFMVKLAFPHLWVGFIEHAEQTPSVTGWRVPAVMELLKAGRTVPGVLLAALLFAVLVLRRGRQLLQSGLARQWLLPVIALVTTLILAVAAMFFLTPNAIAIANYLQPLVVGSFLAAAAPLFPNPRARPRLVGIFVAVTLVGSLRAIGMTTWGLACAADMGHQAAVRRVRLELDNLKKPETGKVVLSAAYLYEAARHTEPRWFHSDWLGKADPAEPDADLERLMALKPEKLILTQYDFYRRYEAVIEQLMARTDLVEIQVVNTASVPAPDSIKPLQRVVQHISWAPVIVACAWREP